MRLFRAGWAVTTAAVMLMAILGGCGNMARPSAQITGVHFQDLGLQSVTIVFDVTIENPYSVPLPLSNLDYSLASSGEAFLSGKAQTQGSVPANGKLVVNVPAKITFMELIKVVKDVRPGSVVPYRAEMGLSVDVPIVGNLRLPLKKEGKLPIPAVPDVEVAQIAWDNVTLSEASGTIRLNMVNRNQFPVDLSKMTYSFSLGGTEVAKTSLAKAVKMDPDGGATLEIPVSISAQQAGLGLIRMLSGSGSAYKFSGSADIGTPFGPMTVPLDKTGNCPFKR